MQIQSTVQLYHTIVIPQYNTMCYTIVLNHRDSFILLFYFKIIEAQRCQSSISTGCSYFLSNPIRFLFPQTVDQIVIRSCNIIKVDRASPSRTPRFYPREPALHELARDSGKVYRNRNPQFTNDIFLFIDTCQPSLQLAKGRNEFRVCAIKPLAGLRGQLSCMAKNTRPRDAVRTERFSWASSGPTGFRSNR